ncbi:hypothetical protein V144x_26580 [Gimesia aquarii]|uniref:Uncharacterized protein n=1 Tax=Gimesia aquarii TaxID=2527964 RepID=A0A517VW18_9PLAN|nr:hypothetical protein V144x_26580 [Gimesia aquarii]
MSEKKRWKILRFLGYAIPILSVVYVLSIGPVLAFIIASGNMRHCTDYGLAGTLYTPILLTMNKSAFITNLVNEYMLLCSRFF